MISNNLEIKQSARWFCDLRTVLNFCSAAGRSTFFLINFTEMKHPVDSAEASTCSRASCSQPGAPSGERLRDEFYYRKHLNLTSHKWTFYGGWGQTSNTNQGHRSWSPQLHSVDHFGWFQLRFCVLLTSSAGQGDAECRYLDGAWGRKRSRFLLFFNFGWITAAWMFADSLCPHSGVVHTETQFYWNDVCYLRSPCSVILTCCEWC